MKFGAFNKNLASEIENLFSCLGDDSTSEDQKRLDQTVNFDDIMARIKNLDQDAQTAPRESERLAIDPEQNKLVEGTTRKIR